MDEKHQGLGKARSRRKKSTDGPARPPRGNANPTLHQLRIFWAVARSETLTNAAKQLGLAQPSLSQQLGRLEANVGTLLFRRRPNAMEITEAGKYLLPKVEQILRLLNEAEDGLAQFSGGQRLTLRLAGVNSALRVLLPPALHAMQALFPALDFDIQESAPTDILELLYGRRINIGLLAANSVAQAGVGFVQVPLLEDPYVLVVPEALVLDGVVDPERELKPEHWALLNQILQFVFGSPQSQRMAEWFDQLLPQHRTIVQCRSFETAIRLVRAGSGICLAPTLAVAGSMDSNKGVRLYRLQAPPRLIVALVPSQYRRTGPYAALLDQLQEAAAAYVEPPMAPTPPFLALDAPELDR